MSLKPVRTLLANLLPQCAKQKANLASSRRVNRMVWWLAPGLLVKRWLFLSVTGVLLVGLGAMIWLKLTPVFYTGQALGAALRLITTYIPSYVSGPVGILLGLWLIFWGQTRAMGVNYPMCSAPAMMKSCWMLAEPAAAITGAKNCGDWRGNRPVKPAAGG